MDELELNECRCVANVKDRHATIDARANRISSLTKIDRPTAFMHNATASFFRKQPRVHDTLARPTPAAHTAF